MTLLTLIACALFGFAAYNLTCAMALIRFESCVGSTLLSDVVRGLIGTLCGDDQRMYFRMICFDMRQIQRYSMMMLFCIVIIYLVVLSTEVLGSLGAFFG